MTAPNAARPLIPQSGAVPARVALVADADPDAREMYRLSLESAGYVVVEAVDGRDALAKAYSTRPDAMIADVQLPFIDGCELCRLLRTDASMARLPLLLLTSNPLAEMLHRIRTIGADAVLIKPFSLAALSEELAKAMEARTTRPAEADGAARPQPDADPAPPTAISYASGARRRRQAHVTKRPELSPPELRCPSCDRALQYDRSHVGGVGMHAGEQWDYYVCAQCGTFQYRHRTRKLRRLSWPAE